MGTELTKGVSFASGQTITHTDLNNLVDDAVVESGAITERTEVTALQDADMFLVYDNSATAVKKVSRLAVARASTAVPASASASGTAGDIAYNATHIFLCVSTDTWKRVAISTW